MKQATQTEAVLMTVHAIAEAIRGLGEVPAGHLYAQVMSRMSLESFEAIIGVLIGAGLVKRGSSHMLTWIGPKPKVKS